MLIYDGDCGFCTATARWLDRRVGPDTDVEPWQALDLSEYELTANDVASAAYWVEPSGELQRGHHAVASSLIAVGGLWRPLGRLLRTPPVSWLAALGYTVVAANRHRLPGSTCAIPGLPDADS
jgi:predicted DCC family thiol-disulfide oxidoreductase YuxK